MSRRRYGSLINHANCTSKLYTDVLHGSPQPPCSYSANPPFGRECVFVNLMSWNKRDQKFSVPASNNQLESCYLFSILLKSLSPSPLANLSLQQVSYISLLRSTAHYMYLRLVHKSYCSYCDPMTTPLQDVTCYFRL